MDRTDPLKGFVNLLTETISWLRVAQIYIANYG